MSKTVYKYTIDSFVDGSDDCSCCSGLTFEWYDAVGWEQNGSATSLWELYVNVLAAHKFDPDYYDEFDNYADHLFEAYEGFTLQELELLCERLGIVLEEVV